MIAIFLGGAQGKVRQNLKQNSVRNAHTKTPKKTCGHYPHSTFNFIEAAFDFRF